jgi:hypothetical protein
VPLAVAKDPAIVVAVFVPEVIAVGCPLGVKQFTAIPSNSDAPISDAVPPLEGDGKGLVTFQ